MVYKSLWQSPWSLKFLSFVAWIRRMFNSYQERGWVKFKSLTPIWKCKIDIRKFIHCNQLRGARQRKILGDILGPGWQIGWHSSLYLKPHTEQQVMKTCMQSGQNHWHNILIRYGSPSNFNPYHANTAVWEVGQGNRNIQHSMHRRFIASPLSPFPSGS